MKKSRLKLIVLEICFFVIASAHVTFGNFGNAYVQNHTLNRPCGLGFETPCVYTPLAAWFEYVLHTGNHPVLLAMTRGRAYAGFVGYGIAGPNSSGFILEELLIISFWMALLNLAYFGGRRLVRVLATRTAVKATQSSEDSKE
jgi:hypothetical protein